MQRKVSNNNITITITRPSYCFCCALFGQMLHCWLSTNNTEYWISSGSMILDLTSLSPQIVPSAAASSRVKHFLSTRHHTVEQRFWKHNSCYCLQLQIPVSPPYSVIDHGYEVALAILVIIKVTKQLTCIRALWIRLACIHYTNFCSHVVGPWNG